MWQERVAIHCADVSISISRHTSGEQIKTQQSMPDREKTDELTAAPVLVLRFKKTQIKRSVDTVGSMFAI